MGTTAGNKNDDRRIKNVDYGREQDKRFFV
jgi:hypothetical protein